MQRCLELARKAIGTARPNPAVGACIVHNDIIIGEGFTSPYGGPHAEINALNEVEDLELLRDATLYVSLEPCSHHGKTPPCTDAIVKSGIARVVIGIQDPNAKVDGKGIRILKDSGCEVTIGVLATACRYHHRRFLTYHEKKRPYVVLKWAQSEDGFLAPDASLRTSNEPFWLTGATARQRVHQWRSEEQAILVGAKTVLADDPGLTVRKWVGKNPIRIVLDRDGEVTIEHRVSDGQVPTLIYSENSTLERGPNLDIVAFSYGKNLVGPLLSDLADRRISSVLVEGGAQTLNSFIEEGLWDEARVFTAPLTLGSGLKAPELGAEFIYHERIGQDTLNIYTHDP